MIEIDTGVFFDPRTGIVVKAIEDGKCALFPPGASPVDGGFLLERDAAEVAEEIADELADQE
jgi:hypothetical protein